jgi:hypothetical protein
VFTRGGRVSRHDHHWVTGLWPAILADTGATVLVTGNAMRLLSADIAEFELGSLRATRLKDSGEVGFRLHSLQRGRRALGCGLCDGLQSFQLSPEATTAVSRLLYDRSLSTGRSDTRTRQRHPHQSVPYSIVCFGGTKDS